MAAAVWFVLWQAVAEIARTSASKAWARYCEIAGALLRRQDNDAAGLAWLRQPQTDKQEEPLGFIRRPGYEQETRKLSLKRDARNELRRELLELEERFEQLLLVELRAERWLTAADRHVSVSDWAALEPRFHYADNAIELEPDNWLRHVRLCRAQAVDSTKEHGAASTVQATESIKESVVAADDQPRPATEAAIDIAITQVYDEAAKKGEKPPNIKEIAKPVKALLANSNHTASGNQIMVAASAPKHKRRRQPIGVVFKKDS